MDSHSGGIDSGTVDGERHLETWGLLLRAPPGGSGLLVKSLSMGNCAILGKFPLKEGLLQGCGSEEQHRSPCFKTLSCLATGGQRNVNKQQRKHCDSGPLLPHAHVRVVLADGVEVSTVHFHCERCA